MTSNHGSGNTAVHAMRDVSFTIDKGEVVALLGPSGAGKSTLLTAVGLINPPTSGTVLIGEKVVLEGERELVEVQAFRRKTSASSSERRSDSLPDGGGERPARHGD